MELRSRNINCLTQISHQSSLSSTLATTTTDFYLPDECWESVFKFFNEVDGNDIRCLKSLSIVSKQFLSITNRLRFSLTILIPTVPFLHLLFKRFTNLTSLNLTHYQGDLTKLLLKISCFPLNITSLNLSNQRTFPLHGLQTFSNKIKTLTSLTYSKTKNYIGYIELDCIADIFPLLEVIVLSNHSSGYSYDNSIFRVEESLPLELFKLRKVSLNCQLYIDDDFLLHLFKNCKHLEEVTILGCDGITGAGIASALTQRPTLRSLSLSDTFGPYGNITSHFIDSLVSLKGLNCLDLFFLHISDDLLYSIAKEDLPLTRLVLQNCYNYSYAGILCLLSKCRQSLQHLDLTNAYFLNDQYVVEFSMLLGNLMSINLSKCNMLTKLALFALVKNCASLSEIKMEQIGRKSVVNHDSLMDFGVYPQLKSLNFAYNSWLSDESIIMFANIFPNLQVLDLSDCNISDKGICQVLRRCWKIRYLNLTLCSTVKLHGLNFEVSKLEVLKLSDTMVDDETLYLISRNCCGLLQLKLKWCYDITNKGVNHVIENCTQLRKINLQFCRNVDNNVVELYF